MSFLLPDQGRSTASDASTFTAGVRYQGAFGALGLLAYGVYMISGTADYTGP